MVQELLVDNAGCRLPCWWGFVPSETIWKEAEHVLSTFIPEIGRGGGPNDNYNNFTTYFDVERGDFSGYVIYDVTAGVINSIWVFPPATEKNYLVHQLLSVYGQPAEVVIQTFPNTPIDYLPFWLILFYPEQGIYAFYEYHAQKQGDLLLGCPQPIGPELYLYNPDEKLTLDEINAFILGEPPWTPRPLAEVTNFDLDNFYQTFQQASNTTCVETPAEIWP